MSSGAFAPEYQGALQELSVNTAYADVLGLARERAAEAEASQRPLELAQARLAVAEACRRLGHLEEAEAAWRQSYQAAESVSAQGAMAWALWSGGTLARQCGRMNTAVRHLSAGRDLAVQAADQLAYGYTLAGIAETLRIQGDYEQARDLHEQILAEARQREESRHIVWALEGLAQIERNTGDLESAEQRFREASETALGADDQRGYAWALRGVADVVSLRGKTSEALELLTRAEYVCRELDLASALAYNRKMRGNVLFRAAWCDEAVRTYRDAREKFRAIREPRGEALSELGLIKSLHRLGRSHSVTERELVRLRDSLDSQELRHTRMMVEQGLAKLAE